MATSPGSWCGGVGRDTWKCMEIHGPGWSQGLGGDVGVLRVLSDKALLIIFSWWSFLEGCDLPVYREPAKVPGAFGLTVASP